MTKSTIHHMRGYAGNAVALGREPLRRHEAGCACVECRTAARTRNANQVDRDELLEMIGAAIPKLVDAYLAQRGEVVDAEDDGNPGEGMLLNRRRAFTGERGYAPPRVVTANRRPAPLPLNAAERRAIYGSAAQFTDEPAYTPPKVVTAKPGRRAGGRGAA